MQISESTKTVSPKKMVHEPKGNWFPPETRDSKKPSGVHPTVCSGYIRLEWPVGWRKLTRSQNMRSFLTWGGSLHWTSTLRIKNYLRGILWKICLWMGSYTSASSICISIALSKFLIHGLIQWPTSTAICNWLLLSAPVLFLLINCVVLPYAVDLLWWLQGK